MKFPTFSRPCCVCMHMCTHVGLHWIPPSLLFSVILHPFASPSIQHTILVELGPGAACCSCLFLAFLTPPALHTLTSWGPRFVSWIIPSPAFHQLPKVHRVILCIDTLHPLQPRPYLFSPHPVTESWLTQTELFHSSPAHPVPILQMRFSPSSHWHRASPPPGVSQPGARVISDSTHSCCPLPICPLFLSSLSPWGG